MRSRAVRLTSSVLALLTLGGAALFVRQTEQRRSGRQEVARTFDARADQATASISAARAAQRAYVAPGQSSHVWMPQVKALANQTAATIDQLRALSSSNDASQALLEASASVAEFITVDKRARDYLDADQSVMAGDVVFSDGGDTAAEVETELNTARNAELRALEAEDIAMRGREAWVAGGSGLLAALVLLLLGASGQQLDEAKVTRDGSLVMRTDEPPSMRPMSTVGTTLSATDDSHARDFVTLSAAAEVCTAFGRVQDVADLKRVLGQAAHALEASGLVVWVGSADGADLRPVVAHGYSDHVLSLMRPVSQQADNAAAAAYRTATLKIVPAKPGTSLGAIVAPILSADGCIGALTAEIRDNGEVSDTLHAVATIFAAQLSAALAPTAASQPTTNPSRAASA